MEQKKNTVNPEIRVYPHTRTRLKIMAAQHQMTMLDLVEWLLAEQEKRAKAGGEGDTQNV